MYHSLKIFLGEVALFLALPMAHWVTCQLCPFPAGTRAPLGLCKPLRRCSVIRILHRKQQLKVSASSTAMSNSDGHAKHNVKNHSYMMRLIKGMPVLQV